MSQAEGIRRYVLKHYVDPARAAGEDELTIRAGDVCRAMGLQGRTPDVCSVLSSRKFLAIAASRSGRARAEHDDNLLLRPGRAEDRRGVGADCRGWYGRQESREASRSGSVAARTDRRREADSRDCLRRKQIGVHGTPDARKRPAHQIRRRSAGGVEGRIDELPASGRRGAFRADVETGAGRIQQAHR